MTRPTRYRVLLVLPVFAFAVFELAAGGRSEPACGDDGYCGQFTTYELPTAAAWLDDHRMYVAHYAGIIQLLDIESGERRTVVEGLSIPQGLTVLHGRLYVTDMGNVCHEMLEEETDSLNPWRCHRTDIWAWPDEKRVEFLRTAGARILSYRIDSTGGLSDQRVIEDRILSHHRDHSANGLINDGEYVYVSIGHPDYGGEGYFTENAQRLHARDDLMGTIARFRPADEEPRLEVHASGLRNVYGISIAPDGTIYGADNDDGSFQKEELNAIVEGGYYGYPSFGTNDAAPEHSVIEPVAVVPGAGSTVAYATKDGVYVAYTHHVEQSVIDRFDYDTFTPERFFRDRTSSYITAILERGDLLYLVALNDARIHVVERRAGSVLGRRPIPDWAGKWTMDSAVIRETYRAAVAGEPAARSTFDVYVEDGRLIYVKEPCQAADMREGFFLQVFPSRRPSEVDWPDVVFLDHGAVLDGICVAAATLPDYEVARVRTGQFGDLWTVEFSDNLNDR